MEVGEQKTDETVEIPSNDDVNQDKKSGYSPLKNKEDDKSGDSPLKNKKDEKSGDGPLKNKEDEKSGDSPLKNEEDEKSGHSQLQNQEDKKFGHRQLINEEDEKSAPESNSMDTDSVYSDESSEHSQLKNEDEKSRHSQFINEEDEKSDPESNSMDTDSVYSDESSGHSQLKNEDEKSRHSQFINEEDEKSDPESNSMDTDSVNSDESSGHSQLRNEDGKSRHSQLINEEDEKSGGRSELINEEDESDTESDSMDTDTVDSDEKSEHSQLKSKEDKASRHSQLINDEDEKSVSESNSMDTDSVDSDDIPIVEPQESENRAASEDVTTVDSDDVPIVEPEESENPAPSEDVTTFDSDDVPIVEPEESENPAPSEDLTTVDSDDVPIVEPEESENPALSEDAADDLRHFDVLDDLDHHTNQEGSDSEVCSNDTLDSDIPDEEIEAMLEEGLPDEFKGKRSGRRSDVLYDEKEKLVLNEIGHNHFDVLPEGWVQVTHNSGMPLYLHKPTRVCTLSKPYFLGPGSVRKHEVPVSAIPCLQYKRALKEEEEDKQRENERLQAAQTCSLPNAKIETIQENRAAQSLDGESLRNYCKALFRFKSIKVMRFKSWSQRRKFTKTKKQRKQLQRPTLPDGTKLITFPVSNNTTGSNFLLEEELPNRPPKHWIMNPSGKSYVCILHEYVQHALKKQPTYKFKELENAATPYSAVVCINDMEYGSGFGSSKKQAKANAARKTLEILIPQMRDKISCDPVVDSNSSNSNQANKASKMNSDADLSFFDEISINDPRVAEFCAKTTEPLPHAILITCLQRNFGLGDMHIKYSVNTLKHQRNEFTMRVGKHEATVICRNKKDGKQRAAQAILQLLHPHIQSWGSLLRLYGSRSVKSFKEKKQLEQEITLLQGKAAVNQPNHAILEKLRQEMRKLSEQREAVKPIGKFLPPDLPTGSSSNLDNVDL